MALVLPAVELGIETAMRRSELCSIVAGNVHMERSFVHLENTKNGDDRDVPLSARAIEILTPLLAAAQGREDDRLFPMAPETLTVYFSRLREAAGLGSIRIHDARHTAATNASKVFTNVLELSAFTGHRSLQTLKKYYHPDATDLAARLPGAGAQLPGDPA